MNPSARRRMAVVVAPALLVVVALFQIRQATVHGQSSWSGVGFGMFATIDNEDSRFLRAYVGDERVPLPEDLADESLDVRVLPTEDRLRRLAEQWRHRVQAAELRVELWRMRFERNGPALAAERMLEVVAR